MTHAQAYEGFLNLYYDYNPNTSLSSILFMVVKPG